MRKLIAYCGIDCADCPIYIVTQNNDEKARQEIAIKNGLRAEDCYCDGCTTKTGKVATFCDKCEVRICTIKKKLENCAYCDDYPCVTLNKLHEMYNANKARATLKEIRRGLNK
jgi:hypothetical protein